LNPLSKCAAVFALVILCAVLISVPGDAQQIGASLQGGDVVLLPGSLTGPGSLGPRGRRRFCNSRSIGFEEWRAAVIDRWLALSDAQRLLLNELSSASQTGLEMIRNGCQTYRFGKDKSQIAVIKGRVETLLRVLETVQPVYDQFYASLNVRQKQVVDALGPRRLRWQW